MYSSHKKKVLMRYS